MMRSDPAIVFVYLFASAIAGCAQAGDSQRGGDGGLGDAPTCSGSVCSERCVDPDSDPMNCGGCGRTCVIPNGAASCDEGSCGVGACTSGFADCDGDPENGCERSAACASGESCTTSCGTIGSLACSSACETTCAPPAEICNLADDDCDGSCEVGLAGCRIGIHRSNGPNGHFYTASATEAACCGMHVESHNFFYLSAVAADGTQPFIRCITGDGHHLYTTDTACEGVGYEGQVGFILREPRCGAEPLYRLRHANGDHFYTVSAPERDSAIAGGYALVGTIGYVFRAP